MFTRCEPLTLVRTFVRTLATSTKNNRVSWLVARFTVRWQREGEANSMNVQKRLVSYFQGE